MAVMFQSVEYQKYLGYDAATKEYRYQYKIIDSDFEEFAVGFAVGVGVGVAVGVAGVVVVAVVVGVGVGVAVVVGVGIAVGVGVFLGEQRFNTSTTDGH